MKKIVCSIRDDAMGAYMQPWYVQTTGMALRAFRKEINTPQSPMYDTPDDFDLYKLGEYDEETGKHEDLPQPERLTRGRDERETLQPEQTNIG